MTLPELIQRWRDRATDMERASNGETWQGEMKEIRRCADELEAQWRIASDLPQPDLMAWLWPGDCER